METSDFYKSGIQMIRYSDVQFILLTRQENSGQIVRIQITIQITDKKSLVLRSLFELQTIQLSDYF